MLRVATEAGLLLLDEGSGSLAGRKVRAVDGPWVIVDDEVITLDSPGAAGVATFDGLKPYSILSVGGKALVGSTAARLFWVLPTGITEPITGFDAIPTRDEWSTPWGAPPDVRSLACTAGDDLLVNVHVGGVWRSTDGGASWTEAIEVDADTHQVLADRRSGIVAVAAAVGFAVSRDDGASWTWSTAGLHGQYCRAVAIADEWALVTASDGPFTKDGALYRRPLEAAIDEPFERCGGTGPLPESFPFNVDTHQLAADGARVVLGTDDGRMFESRDCGATWALLRDDLAPIRAVTLG